MCLAVPVRIVSVEGTTAVVDAEGVRREANVAFLPDVQAGDYVLMHAGFAIKRWSEADYREFKELLGDASAY